MLSEPNQSPLATQSDAELECYLCLAAALQALQQRPAKFAAERRPPHDPTFLRGLQALLKGLRRAERNRTA